MVEVTWAEKEEKTIRRVFMLVALLARSWVSILAVFCAAIARTQTEPRTYGKRMSTGARSPAGL
jgi:hypothetical protein